MLRDIANKYAKQGVRLVIVSVDEPETYSGLQNVAAGFGFSPPIWVATRPLKEFKLALAESLAQAAPFAVPDLIRCNGLRCRVSVDRET